jgi:hypothetical protein
MTGPRRMATGSIEADPIVAGLHAALTALTFTDRDSDAVTELLIETAANWATAEGWRVYRRAASVMHLPPPYEKQHSFLDLACARPIGPPIAVEVDHTARRRTVDKLLEEAAAGRITIWVRWSQRQLAPAPDPIHTVDITVSTRNGRHSRTTTMPAPQHSGFDAEASEQPDLFG